MYKATSKTSTPIIKEFGSYPNNTRERVGSPGVFIPTIESAALNSCSPGRSGEEFELNQVPMTTVMPMINASTARSLPKLNQLISLFFSKFLRCR